mmetsp:Transcript_118362/g.368604  ORF Transcript_118362/g.368604 Transcript_118362/m.368604 type:complete len:127 (+) Transcript_118362:40-420(+)
MAAPALARRVVAMADSRRELVRHELGLDKGLVDFFVTAVLLDGNRKCSLEQRQIVVLGQDGYEMETADGLGLHNSPSPLKVINALSALGYAPCETAPVQPLQEGSKTMWFVIRVPKAFALRHLDLM